LYCRCPGSASGSAEPVVAVILISSQAAPPAVASYRSEPATQRADGHPFYSLPSQKRSAGRSRNHHLSSAPCPRRARWRHRRVLRITGAIEREFRHIWPAHTTTSHDNRNVMPSV
jgi:hypothetical protein